MPAFVVATVTVSDPEKFTLYLGHVRGVMQRYGGAGVVSGAVSDVVEGSAPEGEKVTVLSFPDEALARAYIASDEYQAGKAARQGGAEMVMRLIVV